MVVDFIAMSLQCQHVRLTVSQLPLTDFLPHALNSLIFLICILLKRNESLKTVMKNQWKHNEPLINRHIYMIYVPIYLNSINRLWSDLPMKINTEIIQDLSDAFHFWQLKTHILAENFSRNFGTWYHSTVSGTWHHPSDFFLLSSQRYNTSQINRHLWENKEDGLHIRPAWFVLKCTIFRKTIKHESPALNLIVS